ncbi:MAG: DUF1127 domain-containing protein [Pseudomonadota bacterium]
MVTTTKTPIWQKLLNRIVVANQRYREAQTLKSLPDYRLTDMGMTRDDADRAFHQDRYLRAVDRPALPIARKV